MSQILEITSAQYRLSVGFYIIRDIFKHHLMPFFVKERRRKFKAFRALVFGSQKALNPVYWSIQSDLCAFPLSACWSTSTTIFKPSLSGWNEWEREGKWKREREKLLNAWAAHKTTIDFAIRFYVRFFAHVFGIKPTCTSHPHLVDWYYFLPLLSLPSLCRYKT